MNNYKYDVAISFAGEQREYVEKLAGRLRQCGLKVFYDNWNSTELWGEDLTRYLSRVYSEDALFTLPVFSKQYNEKLWPRFEFEHMQEREYSEGAYILPISFDGSFPDHWPKTRGFISANSYTIDEIAIIVREKVRNKKRGDTVSLETYKTDKIPQTMTITNKDGSTEVVEIILAFEFKDTLQEFVIYTKHETDSLGDTTVYVSELKKDDNRRHLYGVEDKDWYRVKEVLWELSKTDEEADLKMPLTPFFDSKGVEFL